MMAGTFPDYLAAIDKKRNRVFVLATPNLSAIKIDGEWKYCEPLTDEEIAQYELVTDLETAMFWVSEARDALTTQGTLS